MYRHPHCGSSGSSPGSSMADSQELSCAGSDFGDGLSGFTTRRRVRGKSLLCIQLTADGRKCRLCGVKDTVVDYALKRHTILWANPPKNGKSQGLTCFYCLRTFNSPLLHMYVKIQDLQDAILADPQVQKNFKELLELVKTSSSTRATTTPM